MRHRHEGRTAAASRSSVGWHHRWTSPAGTLMRSCIPSKIWNCGNERFRMDGSAPSHCRPPVTRAELETCNADTQRSSWPPALGGARSCLSAVYNQCNPISVRKFIHTVVSAHNDVCPTLAIIKCKEFICCAGAIMFLLLLWTESVFIGNWKKKVSG